MARAAAVGIGVVAIALGLLARGLNAASLIGLAFAASADLPVLLHSLFRHGFATRGAVWSVYGGLVPAIVLVLLSPVVWGSPASLFPGAHFQLFPLQNPGLVSIPLGFLAGWPGTLVRPSPPTRPNTRRPRCGP